MIGPKEYCKLKNKRVKANPDVSTRRIAVEVEVSQFVVHRILKEQGLHPYHVQKVQALDFPFMLTKESKRSTLTRVFKQCAGRVARCGSASR